MNFAADMYYRSLMSLTREDIGQRMVTAELAQGFTIVTDAEWLDWNDWTDWTILSQDQDRIRLVAIEAKKPKTGAFTKLVRAIEDANLIPVLVEPNRTLIDWCQRHGWRCRSIGKGPFRHDVWYRRR